MSAVSTFTTTVCFLAGTLVCDGAERQLVYMLRALQDAPVSCRVMCLTQGEALEDEVRALGVPVEFVGAEQSRPARLKAVINSLRSEPADIIQSTHFYTNIYAALAARMTGAVSIGAIRNDVLSELRSNGVFGWGHLMLPQLLVANSRIGCDRAIARGRSASRVLLVENAVDMDRFGAADDPDRRRDDHTIRLLSVGRLVRQKRMDRFLRIVKNVSDRLPDWKVEARIVGDGPLDTELADLVEELGLAPFQVSLVGRVPDPVPQYNWADVFLLTSDHEGTPNVVIEAMAAGLPVVASAVGGTPDLLSKGGGLLLDPRDEAAFAQHVVDLVLDPQARHEMGITGMRHIAAGRSIGSLRRSLRSVHHLALQMQPRTHEYARPALARAPRLGAYVRERR